VIDLVGGRAAWTAQGFPTEGSVGDRRRISQYAVEVATVGIDATIDDVRAVGSRRWPVPVTSDSGVLLGAVDVAAAALPGSTPVERVMTPAPGTIRPELRLEEAVEQLRADSLDHVFVTAVDGVLLGLVVTDDVHV